MAFGQASGPPATAAQIAELTDLLARAGFDGFREARHPYGLTQRQSNGKFTRDEADELIERLTAEVDGEGAESDGAGPPPGALPDPPRRRQVAPTSRRAAPRAPAVPPADPAPDDVTSAFPDELLADELRRRGWTCTPPG